QLGYSETPKQTAYGFECCDTSYVRFLVARNLADRDEILASHQPAVIRFWYRQHRDEIRPEASFLTGGTITNNSPPNIEPGMIRMTLDANGRLVGLDVRPWAEGNATTSVEPSALFVAAGLNPSRFTPVPPRAIPPMTNDARMAWTGT